MSSLTQCHQNPTAPEARAAFRAANWLSRGVDMLKQVWDFLERAAAGRRALHQLAGADDRMLKDIGLDRSDLRNAAAEPLYRDPTSLLAGRVGEGRTHQPHRLNAGRDRPVRYYGLRVSFPGSLYPIPGCRSCARWLRPAGASSFAPRL